MHQRTSNISRAGLSLKINERCWVCSGFSEQKITYKAYGYTNEKSMRVQVHISHDDFLPKPQFGTTSINVSNISVWLHQDTCGSISLSTSVSPFPLVKEVFP